MLEAFFLGAALVAGQADTPPAEVLRPEKPAPASFALPPAPPDRAAVLSPEGAGDPGKPVAAGSLLLPDLPAREPDGPVFRARAAEDQPAPAPAPEPVTFPVPMMPAPPAAAAPAAAAPSPPPDRFALMKELQGTWLGYLLDGTRTQVTGWVQGSYTASSVADNDLPVTFNYRANEPMLNQAWVRIDRPPVTTGTTEPTLGFRSDWIFGEDYRFTLPQRGIFHGQLTERANGQPNNYGVDPVQFYLDGYVPTFGRGLDVKVGRFYTPYGVESIEAPSTPLVSHSYIFSNGSPFTHTGVLTTLTVTPVWTVQAGAVLGSDVFFDPADEPTGILTAQWTQPGGRNVVKFTTIFGLAKFDNERQVNNINVFDTVWTHIFNPVLTYNFEVLYGYERNIPDQSLPDGSTVHVGNADWWGVAQYLFYTINPRLTANARVEVFGDPQGVRTNTAPGATVADAKGLYTEITLGLTFKPRRLPSGTGVIFIRPELRYDYNDESRPFMGHHGLATAATDFIVRW